MIKRYLSVWLKINTPLPFQGSIYNRVIQNLITFTYHSTADIPSSVPGLSYPVFSLLHLITILDPILYTPVQAVYTVKTGVLQ